MEVWKVEKLLYLMTTCAWYYAGCAKSWLLQKLLQVPILEAVKKEKVRPFTFYCAPVASGNS